MLEEHLWDLANAITAFAAVQGIAFSFALATQRARSYFTVVTVLYSLWYQEFINASSAPIEPLTANRENAYRKCKAILLLISPIS